MYEPRRAPPLPRPKFLGRMARHGVVVVALIAASLGVGMLGYHGFEKMPWLDAYASAAMILSGMGPLGELHTTAGKIFAGSYALFSGIMFISVAGILLAPVAHRVMHKFHFAADTEKTKG